MLDEQVHAHFTEALSAWGMASPDIEDTLRWATFGPGLVQMNHTDPGMPLGLGIVVDETQDEDLAKLFAIRDCLDDDEFLAQWEISPDRTSRVILDPTGPQAMFRYTIAIERPERIERRFLFLVHALVPQLIALQRPGTQLWLIPQQVAQTTPGAITSAYDVLSRCLPIGKIKEPLPGLEKALEHVVAAPEHLSR